MVACCRCTIGLNIALMTLFLSLTVTFFLLAAGVTHKTVNKVSINSLLGDCFLAHWTRSDFVCSIVLIVCADVQAGGYFGVWTAGVAWYIAFAELLNEVWFRGRVSVISFAFLLHWLFVCLCLHSLPSAIWCGLELCLHLLQVVIPLGSMTWPNKKHESAVGKKDDLPSSQRSIQAGGTPRTVV